MGVQLLSSYWSIYFPDLHRTLEMQQATTHHFLKVDCKAGKCVNQKEERYKNLKENSAYTLQKLFLNSKAFGVFVNSI
jgi:hypothetical protein